MAETPSTKDGNDGCMPSTADETRTMKMKRGLGSASTSEREGSTGGKAREPEREPKPDTA
jgi:hypothetical protein